MVRVWKALAFAGGTAAAGSFVLLGVLWTLDRVRRWETPRLETATFSVMRGVRRADGGPGGLALVPVNLRCPHCLVRLRALRDSCRSRGGCPDLVALIVDQERAPSRAQIDSLGVGRVWWDRRGIWRNRWGHRIYGEVLWFDASGRHRETLPPVAGPRARPYATTPPERGKAGDER
jgi:hypothetical protein